MRDDVAWIGPSWTTPTWRSLIEIGHRRLGQHALDRVILLTEQLVTEVRAEQASTVGTELMVDEQCASRDEEKSMNSADARRELAPTGSLRAAINTANPALARPGADGADPTGIAVDLARELAGRLDVPLDLVTYGSAGKIVAAMPDAWDVAFLAIEPERATTIAFTAPYLVIEGTYAVAQDAAFETTVDVDVDGVTVGVSAGAAYVPHLARTLTRAQIVTADTPGAAMALLATGQVDATAGVRQALTDFAETTAGVRVLPDRFLSIQQSLGVPIEREAGAAYVREFVVDIHRSGRLLALLDVHGQAASMADLAH